jgi:MSHA biogenesis protein MshP
MFPEIKKQKGFAIVSAIFLIVVLAFLGVSMARIFSSGQQAINQDISSLQAYYAGQSGLQWGMYQTVFVGTAAAGAHTISFSNSGLTNTNAAITITSNTILGRDYYLIKADGEYGSSGNPEYAQRKLELRFNP